jgi:deoxycytidylate deaminase
VLAPGQGSAGAGAISWENGYKHHIDALDELIGGCARCNGKAKSGEALDECLCLHAEENALLEAGRERMGDGAVLYCNT